MADLTQDELMLDGTPEQIAALEAKYGEGAGDFELPGDSREQFVAGQTPQAPAPAPTGQQEATGGSAPASDAASGAPAGAAVDERVAGIATKDGKHVLPYTVLRETRREAQTYRQRATEAERQVNELKAQLEAVSQGKPMPKSTTEGQEPDLDDLLVDFPQLQGLVTEVKELRAKTAPPAAQADPRSAIDQELDAQEELDAALAARPLLTEYSQKGGVVWARAIEIDKGLLAGDYANKPVAERLTETERLLAKELGRTVPAPGAGAPTALARGNEPGLPQNLPRVDPTTLSDLGGGRAPTEEISQLASMRGDLLVNRFAGMSDEEMDRILVRAA